MSSSSSNVSKGSIKLEAGDVSIGNVDVDSIAAGDNNIGNVDIASALPAGTNAIGKLAANSGVDIGDVDVTSIAAGTNTIGNVVSVPSASQTGLSIYRTIDLDETEEEVKATAGRLYGYYLFNLATANRYIKFYNADAATVSVGTTTPVLTFPLAAGQGANLTFSSPVTFGTAITIAATTGVADNDTGAPGSNEIVANIYYI